MEDGGWRRRLAHIASCVSVLLVTFASTARAACPPWRGPAITVGPSGEQLCAKHHEALQKTTVYGPDPAICILVQQTKKAAKARACCPNAMPFGISRTKSRLYSRAVETSYCNQCETFVQAQVRK
jgi:hypothetical protein